MTAFDDPDARERKARRLEQWCWDHHVTPHDLEAADLRALAHIARAAGVNTPRPESPTWGVVARRLAGRALWAALEENAHDARSSRAGARPGWIASPSPEVPKREVPQDTCPQPPSPEVEEPDTPQDHPADGDPVARHLAHLVDVEPAYPSRDGLTPGPGRVVLCADGPYEGQSFTVGEWRDRVVAAARLTALDGRVRAPAAYGLGPVPDTTPAELADKVVTALWWRA